MVRPQCVVSKSSHHSWAICALAIWSEELSRLMRNATLPNLSVRHPLMVMHDLMGERKNKCSQCIIASTFDS